MRQALVLLPVLSLAAEKAVHAETPAPDAATLPDIEANVASVEAAGGALTNSAVTGETPLLVAKAGVGAEALLWSAIEHNDSMALSTALRSGAKVNITRDGAETPLMAAAKTGNIELVAQLVESRAALDAVDARGFTALMHAADARNTQIVEALLDAGADPDVQNLKGETALERLCYNVRYLINSSGHEAANARQTERRSVVMDTIRVLLDKGANPNVFSSQKQNPLVLAASYGELPLVQMLLHSGANVHGKTQAELRGAEVSFDTEPSPNVQWQTPLQALMAGGNRKRVEKIFLSDGGMISPANREQMRAKASAQDVAILDCLIGAGATEGDGLQRFALLDAASGPAVGGGRAELVKRLVKSGVPVHVSDVGRRLALKDAVRQEETRLAAVQSKAAQQNRLASMVAVTPGQAKATGPAVKLSGRLVTTVATAKILPRAEKVGRSTNLPAVEKSFDAKYGAPKGWTPLLQAARTGDLDVVKYLLSLGANPNTRDAAGKTPLMHVCGAGRSRWVRELPVERARTLVNIGEDDYRMASRVVSYSEKRQWRDWAEEGDLAIVRALLKAGADINSRDREGRTPLMYAARRSSPVVVRELIKRGADVNSLDTVGKTALMQVIHGGRFIAAESWVSPVLKAEAREARAVAMQARSYEATMVAQKAIERYDLHRSLTRQEAERDDSLILCELRRAKTNLSIKDAKGRTALDLAIAAQQQHAVRWILADVY